MEEQNLIVAPINVDYVEIVRKAFPKQIFVEETKCNIFRKEDTLLFRQEHYNNYCFLRYIRCSNSYSITLFKSNWKDPEQIEDDYLEAISFVVFKKSDLITIMNCIV